MSSTLDFSDAEPAHSGGGVRTKLSVMMFLEFFIWGAWLPLIFGYLPSLGFDPFQQSCILNAFAVASFTAMFFFTQFADRNFAAERFVSLSHLIGGLAILGLFFIRKPEGTDPAPFWPFFLLMLVHSLFYVPTISITNSIAFASLKDPQREFGPVRLWGTIGWIAASWPFVFILVDWAGVKAWSDAPEHANAGIADWLGTVLATPLAGDKLQEGVRYTFLASGVASLLLSAFSLTLPHTPPKPAAAGAETFAWLQAMKLLAVPYVLVLFFVTFFDASVHQCHFIWTNDYLKSIGIPPNWVMPVMSVGQIAEIGTMAILGYCLKGLGWRNIMVLGILGHTLRFGVFAFVPEATVAVVVNVLHGVCYAFFFATVYIFVDEFFPKSVRSSAQGLFNFLILGLGPFVGNFVWPFIGDMCRVPVPVEGSGQSVIVARDERSVAFYGTAEPGAEISLNLNVGKETPLVMTATAGADGGWATTEQYIGGSEAERVTVAASGNKVGIDGAKHVNFRTMFLFPSGTALFAAIVLALFFRPPRVAPPQDDRVAESEGAESPAP